MKDLLEFIIKGIIEGDDFSIEEATEDERVNFEVSANQDDIGLIIGKAAKPSKQFRSFYASAQDLKINKSSSAFQKKSKAPS